MLGLLWIWLVGTFVQIQNSMLYKGTLDILFTFFSKKKLNVWKIGDLRFIKQHIFQNSAIHLFLGEGGHEKFARPPS